MKTAPLATVAAIERSSVDPSTLDPATPYLGLEHIERGGNIIGCSTVGAAQVESAKYRFTPEHVLFGKLRPNLGKISRPDFSGVCSTDILPLMPSVQLNRDYLAHFLAQPSMVALAASRTSGANLPRLSPRVLASFEVPLPSLDDQQRIAATLDAAHAIRGKRRALLGHVNLLKDGFVSGLMSQSTWNATLADLAQVQIGPFGSLLHQEDYLEGGVALLNPMHIREGKLWPDPSYSVSTEKAESLATYRVRTGDVVLGRRGEMGRAGIVRPEHDGLLCGTGSLILRPRAGVTSEFLHAVVTSARVRAHFERASIGTTLPNLNSTIVSNTPAPTASPSLQRTLAQRVAALDDECTRVERALAKDDELFDSLQARAFSGEL